MCHKLIKSGGGESLEVLHQLGAFPSDSMEGCILMPCFPGSVEFKEATCMKNSIFSNDEENLEKSKSRPSKSKSTLVSVKSILTLDGENPIEEFSDKANDIFNCSSDSERVHSLKTNLKRKGVLNTHLKDICEGRLNWKSSQVPGDLSFLLVQRDFLDIRMSSADTLHVIDLKSRNKGFDDD